MHVRSDLGEWRIGVRMRNIFPGEQGDVAVSAVNVFFYRVYPEL